ncbi:hypothetical protein EON65_54610 [archaeon]|nr:MAG: hypothetical protein EON65_54610 [archaeon]
MSIQSTELWLHPQPTTPSRHLWVRALTNKSVKKKANTNPTAVTESSRTRRRSIKDIIAKTWPHTTMPTPSAPPPFTIPSSIPLLTSLYR